MNTTTRRTILAGAAALPLLPGAALAASATLPLMPVSAIAAPGNATDPAVAAYRTWREDFTTLIRLLGDRAEDEAAHNAAHDREFASRLALSDTIATTPAGLVLQIQFAFAVFGEVDHDDDWFDLDKYQFHGWSEDHEGRLLRSMLTGAENLAGEGV